MTISQREARRLKRRVSELERDEERRRNAWKMEWPGGTQLATILSPDPTTRAAITTARKLEHAVVATVQHDGTLLFYALPLAKRDA